MMKSCKVQPLGTSSVSARLTCSEYGENAEECAENAHRCGPWFAEENEVREKPKGGGMCGTFRRPQMHTCKR